jgi:glycosyltransferase involved in cell wall biosynthesis
MNSNVQPQEIIFVDDASTDNSIEKAKTWKNAIQIPITIVENKSNIGFANCLNIGVSKAKGDLILRIDSDDFLHPFRIEREKIIFLKNPYIQVIGSNTYYFNDKRRRVVGQSHFPLTNKDIYNALRKGFISMANTSFTARKEVFELFKYEQQFVPYEEYVIFSKMIKQNIQFINLREPLTYYRVHNQNRSLNFIVNKQRGIRSQRIGIWGEKTLLITMYYRSFSDYLYWKSLKSTTTLKHTFYKFIASLLKANRLLSRLFRRYHQSF